MKIKIISDGTAMGTKVVCAETGEPIDGAYAFEISGKRNKPTTEASIHFYGVQLEFTGEAEAHTSARPNRRMEFNNEYVIHEPTFVPDESIKAPAFIEVAKSFEGI